MYECILGACRFTKTWDEAIADGTRKRTQPVGKCTAKITGYTAGHWRFRCGFTAVILKFT